MKRKRERESSRRVGGEEERQKVRDDKREGERKTDREQESERRERERESRRVGGEEETEREREEKREREHGESVKGSIIAYPNRQGLPTIALLMAACQGERLSEWEMIWLCVAIAGTASLR